MGRQNVACRRHKANDLGAQPRCPKCQARMMLALIESAPAHSDLRTFECPKGNHIQVLKNANQMTANINTATPVLITSSASTDGPVSAWRASSGVSMIIPGFLIGMTLSLKF
jgi:hypothetical protein